jgi:hypothetical protein
MECLTSLPGCVVAKVTEERAQERLRLLINLRGNAIDYWKNSGKSRGFSRDYTPRRRRSLARSGFAHVIITMAIAREKILFEVPRRVLATNDDPRPFAFPFPASLLQF